MKKTSKYAMKLRRNPEGGTYNGAAWANVIQRSRPYSTEDVVPGWCVGSTMNAAVMSALRVRQAFESIRLCKVPPEDKECHDLLVNAIGLAVVRAAQVGGDTVENPAIQILQAATRALQRMIERHQRLGVWGFDGPALEELAAGLDVYEQLMMASSPAEMTAAHEARLKILKMKKELSV